MFRNDFIKRDMWHILSLKLQAFTLERWMGEKGYNGTIEKIIPKAMQDHDTVHPYT